MGGPPQPQADRTHPRQAFTAPVCLCGNAACHWHITDIAHQARLPESPATASAETSMHDILFQGGTKMLRDNALTGQTPGRLIRG